jgi:phage terminase large subunit-like protein
MQHIRELDATYDVLAVGYDPRFFEYSAAVLDSEHVRMAKVPQSVERMTTAIGGLYNAILEGTLTHDGDALFTRQVLNGVARYNEHGFTLAKSKSRGKIDSTIAMAIAHDRAQVVRPRRRAASAMSF